MPTARVVADHNAGLYMLQPILLRFHDLLHTIVGGIGIQFCSSDSKGLTHKVQVVKHGQTSASGLPQQLPCIRANEGRHAELWPFVGPRMEC